jgi:hypothetical protein
MNMRNSILKLSREADSSEQYGSNPLKGLLVREWTLFLLS